MCLIIYKPKDVKIPFDIIKKAWTANKDGAGFMASIGDSFHFEKGFFKEKDLLKALKLFSNHQLAIHLRLATHGAVEAINCHPFIIDSRKIKRTSGKAESLLMHNGVISAYGSENSSDSWHFAREAVAPLNLNARDRLLRAMPGRFVLGQNGKFYLYGLDKHEQSGCFVSNKTWMFEVKNFGVYQSSYSTGNNYRGTGLTPTVKETQRNLYDWNPNSWEDN